LNYWLNLFSPDTYDTFSASDRSISGFRRGQWGRAQKIVRGDRFICYMTKLSRWVGVLEVVDGPFIDDTPIYQEDDPFVVRFRVRPLTWHTKEGAVPIRDDDVWKHLSFTKDHKKGSSTWTGKLRSSLNQLSTSDGEFLERVLSNQRSDGTDYPVDASKHRRSTATSRVADGGSSETVPPDPKEDPGTDVGQSSELRESIQVQALLARIGAQMGYEIWVPRADRRRVAHATTSEHPVRFLDVLPLNYDERTIKTIEQIDVLWLQRRAIARAFEVEHTTAVYSGILRMADLLALQPNMDIQLHIVAPDVRREKVFSEILRPVFSQLDRGPLADSCTYISYSKIHEIMVLPHLDYLPARVLDQYAEKAAVGESAK